MQEIGNPSRIRLFFRRKRRRVGAAASLVFGLWFLSCAYLGVAGRVIIGHSARVPTEGIPADTGPVLYFYRVEDKTYHGWRRGIQWGEQPLAVVYWAAWPRIHVTGLRPAVEVAPDLWRDPDYLVRIVLLAVAFVGSLVLMVFGPYVRLRLPGAQFLFPTRGRGPFDPTRQG